jgi:hypothetical protein
LAPTAMLSRRSTMPSAPTSGSCDETARQVALA